MLMIIRLYPKTDLNKIWEYIENEMSDKGKYSITPLYATMTEGMMDVGLIFDVNEPNELSEFLTEEIGKCDEVYNTKTITLMKPIFFPIPKRKPESIYRYLIRIYAHPRYYKKIYDYLLDFNYPFNLFPIYISYSLGEEDIIMNIGADSPETVKKFVREHIRSQEGVEQCSIHAVYKSKRFVSLDKLIEKQKKYLDERKMKRMEEVDLKFDWIENFEEYAKLTGAFPEDY